MEHIWFLGTPLQLCPYSHAVFVTVLSCRMNFSLHFSYARLLHFVFKSAMIVLQFFLCHSKQGNLSEYAILQCSMEVFLSDIPALCNPVNNLLFVVHQRIRTTSHLKDALVVYYLVTRAGLTLCCLYYIILRIENL